MAFGVNLEFFSLLKMVSAIKKIFFYAFNSHTFFC